MEDVTVFVIYLDYNASTPLAPGVLEATLPFLRDQHENPSGGYLGARRARAALERARGQVADLCGAGEESVIFTSGATEAINLAIRTAEVEGPRNGRILISAVEHSAVREAAIGWFGAERVVELPVDQMGNLDSDNLREKLKNEDGAVSMVCVMAVNNETGLLPGAGEAIRLAQAARVPALCDAVQAWGRLTTVNEYNQAAYSVVSGHKIGGPKGAGALVLRPGFPVRPLLFGGGQEAGRRSGTEALPALVGFGEAARIAAARASDAGQLAAWETRHRSFERGLRKNVAGVTIVGAEQARLCNTSMVRFEGVPAEALLVLLDQAGLACSPGSSCQTASGKPSRVLLAMGYSPNEARECVRFSSGPDTTSDELARAVDIIAAAVARARERLAPSGRVVRASKTGTNVRDRPAGRAD